MAEKIEKTVFISYRRATPYHARTVYQDLLQYDYDVFLDSESINSGDFEQIIPAQIETRAHFIIILTPSALKRCSDPEDWLRREIEHAIDHKRNVIPLMFDGFKFTLKSVKSRLVDKLSVLDKYNGIEVPAAYFNAAMEKLRNGHLNIPVDAVLHPTPPSNAFVIKQKQIDTSTQLQPTKAQLEAARLVEVAWQHNEDANYGNALVVATEAIHLNPEYAIAYFERGFAKDMNRDCYGALDDYSMAIFLDPNDILMYVNRGNLFIDLEEYEHAISDFDTALRLNSKYADAYLGRGRAFEVIGLPKRAFEDYSKAIELDASKVEAYRSRARSYRQLGKRLNAELDEGEADRIEAG